MKSMISASIMCADALDMGKDLRALAQQGVEYCHCDVMDGHFVPNLMLSAPTISALKKANLMPLDIHLMVDNPGEVIPWLAFGEGDIVAVHAESTPHLQRVLALIAAKGATPALALNPATPLCMAQHVLPDIGMLLIMTVNPGFAGQKLVPQTLQKITQARRMLDDAGYANMPIEVDGNCSFENIPLMQDAGANIFVVGSSSVFDPRLGVEKGVQMVRQILHD